MFNIQQVIQQAGVSSGEKIADFGAGSGFIATQLAKAVGENGRVFAIDILEEPLEALNSKANNEKLFQIKTIKSDLEKENGSTLDPGSCDWVVMANLLFQIGDPSLIIKEAKRILKQGGKVLGVEWLPEKLISQESHFLHSPELIKKVFKNTGFNFVKEFSPGPNHYALIYQK
jgi:ubiquinone/menaquinone biosynthesis C-methylase UbiE